MSEITRCDFPELTNQKRFGFPLKLSFDFPILPCKIEGITELDLHHIYLFVSDWKNNIEMLPNIKKMSFVQCNSAGPVLEGRSRELYVLCSESGDCVCSKLHIESKEVRMVIGHHCVPPIFHHKTESLFLETLHGLPLWKVDNIISSLSFLPNLRKLVLANIHIHPTWVNRILRACPKLTHLSVCLIACDVDELAPTFQETHQLIRRHRKLINLRIQGQNDDSTRRLVAVIVRALHLRPTAFKRLSLCNIKYDNNLVIQLCSLLQKGLDLFHITNTLFRQYSLNRQWRLKFCDLLEKNVKRLRIVNADFS